MEPDEILINDLYRERVLRARAMPPEQKLLAGARLFNRVCRLMIDGIRSQFPEADDKRANEILVERLQRLKNLENVH
jgi:hypothetical protein